MPIFSNLATKMRTIKKITTIFIILFPLTLLSQTKDRIYFNSKWEETTKEKASYYRELPLEEKSFYYRDEDKIDMVFIKDYYISGELQFVGWAEKNNENRLLDEAKWFYKNGNLNKKAYFLYNPIIGFHGLHNKYQEYHENGTIYKDENYDLGRRNGKANYYDTQGKLIANCTYKYGNPYNGTTNCFATYKNGELINKKLFYENSENLAYEEHKDLINKRNSYKKYYRKNGELLKAKKVEFYRSKKCGYVTGIKHISQAPHHSNYHSGNDFYYDKKGKLHKGVYKNGRYFNGSFYIKDSQLSKEEDYLYYVKTFKNGEIKNSKTYVKDSLFTNGNYVNGKPYDGTFLLNGTVITSLKNGVKEGKEFHYYNIGDFKFNYKPIAYFNYKKGVKEGDSNVYFEWSNQNYKMIYKNDKPYEGILKEGKNLLEFKNGKNIKTKKRKSYRSYGYYEIYENGLKTRIEYLFLDNNKKEIKSGFLKKGKAYNGYFFNTQSKEILLDYYENGIKNPKLSIKLNNIKHEEIRIIDN